MRRPVRRRGCPRCRRRRSTHRSPTRRRCRRRGGGDRPRCSPRPARSRRRGGRAAGRSPERVPAACAWGAAVPPARPWVGSRVRRGCSSACHAPFTNVDGSRMQMTRGGWSRSGRREPAGLENEGGRARTEAARSLAVGARTVDDGRGRAHRRWFTITSRARTRLRRAGPRHRRRTGTAGCGRPYAARSRRTRCICTCDDHPSCATAATGWSRCSSGVSRRRTPQRSCGRAR